MTAENVDELNGEGKGGTAPAGEGEESGAVADGSKGSGDGREVSPEELELQQAESELAKADGGGKPPEGEAGDGKAKPDEAKEGQPAPARTSEKPEGEGEGDGDGQPKTVPVSVVKKLRTDLSRSRHREAQLEGANATLQVMLRNGVKLPEGSPEGQPAAESTPQDRLTAIKAEKSGLSEKFDTGEITAKQWETERQKLEEQEWDIRESMRTPAQQAPAKDLGLEEHAVSLEKQYPILLDLSEAQLEPLKVIAYAQAERDGKPIQVGPLGTKDLRERMAKLAQANYGTGTPAPATTSRTTEPATPAGLSNTGKARAAKTELAENLPPDAGRLGSAAPAGGVSEADLEAQLDGATEEEQIALLERHPGLVRKVMGEK